MTLLHLASQVQKLQKTYILPNTIQMLSDIIHSFIPVAAELLRFRVGGHEIYDALGERVVFGGKDVANPIYMDAWDSLTEAELSDILVAYPDRLPRELFDWFLARAVKPMVPSPESSPVPVLPLSRCDGPSPQDLRDAATFDCKLHKHLLTGGLGYSRGEYSTFAPWCTCHRGQEEEEGQAIADALSNLTSPLSSAGHLNVEYLAQLLQQRAFWLKRTDFPGEPEEESIFADYYNILKGHVECQSSPDWVVDFVSLHR